MSMTDEHENISRVAIYVRVSTAHQAQDGYSLRTQEEDLTAYASSRNWAYEVYREPGRSGETLEGRPALQDLLTSVAAGQVDGLLVMDTTRLGRDNLVIALIYDHLRKARVPLITPSGIQDLSDPHSEAIGIVFSAFSTLEQRVRRDKMMRGQSAAAAEGRWLGGSPPFGYQVGENDDNEGRLVPEPRETAVVQEAVRLIIDEGQSTYEAAQALNRLGLGPRRASEWRHQNLRRMLQQESLRGRAVWGKDREQPFVFHIREPVLNEARFEALQRALRATSMPRKRKAKKYPLTGYFFAPCGAHYTGAFDKNRRNYRCVRTTMYSTEEQPRCEDSWRPKATEVEAAVWREVARALHPDALRPLARRWLEEQEERALPDLAEARQEVEYLEHALSVELASLLEKGLDGAAVAKATETLNENLRRARERHRALERDATLGVNESQATRLAHAASERLGDLTYTEQRQLLELLDVRVTVVEEGSRWKPGVLRLEGALPPTVLTQGDVSVETPRLPGPRRRRSDRDAWPGRT